VIRLFLNLRTQIVQSIIQARYLCAAQLRVAKGFGDRHHGCAVANENFGPDESMKGRGAEKTISSPALITESQEHSRPCIGNRV
jgi:hypothetical protein